MFDIIDGVLLKCNVEDDIIYLPDSVKIILPNSFKKCNPKKIVGNEVKYILGLNSNVEVLDFPKLKRINKLDCPNLVELTISKDTYIKKISKLPMTIRIGNCEYKSSDDLVTRFKNYDEEKDINAFKENTNIIHLKDNIIEYVSYDNENLINSIVLLNNILNKIPEHIKNIILDKNDIFILDIYMTESNDFVGGLASKELNLSLVSQKYLYTLVHEMGHLFDFETNLSDTDEFKTIYEAEKDYINGISSRENMSIMSHVKDKKEEFFAESFKRYILDRENFELDCPNTKKFFDDALNIEKYDIKAR